MHAVTEFHCAVHLSGCQARGAGRPKVRWGRLSFVDASDCWHPSPCLGWAALPCLACNHGRGSVGIGGVRSHASFECLGGSGGRLPAAVSEGCGDRILSAKCTCLVPLQDLSLAGGCQTVIGTRSHALSHALGSTFHGGHRRSPGIETAGHLEVDFWVESLPPRWRPLCQS